MTRWPSDVRDGISPEGKRGQGLGSRQPRSKASLDKSIYVVEGHDAEWGQHCGLTMGQW
jgi:hypothetical protein